MKKTYKVAGHKFAISMPDDFKAWSEMWNYEPFLVEDTDNCIFEANMLDCLPDTSSKQVVVLGTPKPGFPFYNLYKLNDDWMIEVALYESRSIQVVIFCDKGFSKARFYVAGDSRFSVNTVLMLMFAFASACKDTLLIHASVTMHAGKGFLFLGKSGTGKSTHSQLWINNIEGCELLNDDNPALRVESDGTVRVYGTPWSGKTLCYRNLDVPVGAIVDLHQAKQNMITRLSLPKAYAVLYVSISGHRFITEMADGLHAANAKIVSTVPCYSLDCLPNAEAAWLCYKTIAQ